MNKENKQPYDENGYAHGYWEEYYENGNLEYKGSYIHGKEYGYWEIYHRNGKLAYKGLYIHGKKYGYWGWYNQNGYLTYKAKFRSNYRIYKTSNNKLIL